MPRLLALTGLLSVVTGLFLPALLARIPSLAALGPLLVLTVARLLSVALRCLTPTLPPLLATATGLARLTGLLVALSTLLAELAVLASLTPLPALTSPFRLAFPAELSLLALLTELASLAFTARLLPRRRLTALLTVLTGLFLGPATGLFAASGPLLASFMLSALSRVFRPSPPLSTSPLFSSPRSVLP